jgi:ribosome-associated protein
MDDEQEPKSRSQLKREVEEKQALGERLIELPDSRLAKLGLPEELLEAIRLARRLTKRGALKRQRQFIGVLMRSLETGPIERAMAELDHRRELEKEKFHRAEQCRDRLLAGDNSCLEELIAEFPRVDIQHLRGLVRNAGREEAAAKPLRASRLIFRYLSDLFTSQVEPPPEPPDGEDPA